jgi:hypothetical protein
MTPVVVVPPMQVPFEQVWPLVQALPHMPQLATSVCVLMHALLQNICPDGHVHMPPVHERPPLHALPQLPQFVALVMVLTQALLQKL